MNRPLLTYFILLAGALLVRLPFILSDNFVLDGDEAIEALQLMNWLSGEGVRPFFMGQNYGFVLPELFVTAPFALLFGVSEFTVKLPLLLWFVLGIFFIHQTVKYLHDDRWAWLISVLLITAPTWLLWSMRLRGGYVVAFALCHAVIYFVLSGGLRKAWHWFLMGILCGLIALAQAIWLPAAMGFLFYGWLSQPKKWQTALMILVGMLVATTWVLPFWLDEPYHQPQLLSLDSEVIEFNFSIYVSYLERAFQGLYLHGKAYRALLSANVFGLVTLLLSGVVLIQSLWNWKRDRYLSLLASVGIWLLLIGSIFLTSAAPRYALPIFGLILILFAVNFRHPIPPQWLIGVFIPLILLGLHVGWNADEVIYEDFKRSEMKALLQELEEENIQGVFTDNYMLQWQIKLYSQSQIEARSAQDYDRLPERISSVNALWKEHPEATALVGWDGAERCEVNYKNDAFILTLEPDQQCLTASGFEDLEGL